MLYSIVEYTVVYMMCRSLELLVTKTGTLSGEALEYPNLAGIYELVSQLMPAIMSFHAEIQNT